MTLTRFVTKNAFRNRRRSILTVLSIGFSLLLLTLMMTIWRSFYIAKGSPESAQRLLVRHKVSLVFNLPYAYREKIRAVPGVTHVVNQQWFGGIYKDDKPENFFAQFATDPEEMLKVYPEFQIPADQVQAWQHDRAGVIVDAELAKKHGWKIGDHLNLKGTIFPLNPELTIRGMFTAPTSTQAIYFNKTYLDEGYADAKGKEGVFAVLVDTPEDVPRVATAIDDMFRNAPYPTKTETERAFQLDFVQMLGNVKAFILSICSAVVFTILLVSANTMAMSIRERTREVAVLKTLGFTRNRILGLFVGEAVSLALVGGIVGTLIAYLVVAGMAKNGGFMTGLEVTFPTVLLAWLVAALVGFLSAFIPSYHASQVNIVEGLRHIG
ncbi:MAG TPA: FtsX-like permease family protein [Terriglobales bacterium]|nr:FtsX-like permease family protein [Terriglobales bacterium]